jgi:hypothetical protein
MNSITSYQAQFLTGLKQALNMSMMQKALNQDAQSVQNNIKIMEQSVTPHKGQSIDMKL